MLGKYIKSKNKYILLFLLYLGIFCLIAYLYDMPIDACLYAWRCASSLPSSSWLTVISAINRRRSI